MFRVIIKFLMLAGAASLSTALEHFDKYREGTCSGVPLRPIKATREFVDSLKYISAGSRYHMYRMASQMPNYNSLREDEFYYDFCYGRNTSSSEPIGAAIGFGQLLSTFKISTRHGIYIEATPTDPSKSWDTLRQTVTLTDNRSFAFIVNCWTGIDQRAWDVVTLTPNIDSSTQRVIEDHAASLGFKREHFVFLRYDSCRWGSPIFYDDERRASSAHPVTPVVKPPALKRTTVRRKPEATTSKPLDHNDVVGRGWTA